MMLVGYVAQIHRAAMIDGDYYGFEVLAAREEVAGVHPDLPVVFSEIPRLHACIGGLQMSDNRHRRQAVGV